MIEGIDRIAVAVKNLDKSIEFFSDLLGVEFDIVGETDQMGMRGAYSASGLELIEPLGKDTIIGKFIEHSGEGLWGIVFKVKNLEEAIKHFESRGMKQAGIIKAGDMREVAFHPKGSYGVEIILAEYPAKHPATVAAWAIKSPDTEE